MKRKEKDIQKAILDYLALFPKKVKVWRQNTGALKIDNRFVRFGQKGAADITGILYGGRRLEIEVKAPGKYPSPAQRAFGADIIKFGGVYFVARDVDDVERELKL